MADGGLARSGGVFAALPMPLGSDSALGLAGPNGTPDIAEFPAPAEPAGGVNCANALPGAIRASNTSKTNAVLRDIKVSLSGSHPTIMWRTRSPASYAFTSAGGQIVVFPPSGPVWSRRRRENQA